SLTSLRYSGSLRIAILKLLHAVYQVRIDRHNRLGVGDLKQSLHWIAWAGNAEVPSLLTNLSKDMHDDPETRAVHELDVGEVKHKFARALLNQRIEQRLGFAEARPQREAARAGDPGDIRFELEDFGFQHHGCVVPLGEVWVSKVSRLSSREAAEFVLVVGVRPRGRNGKGARPRSGHTPRLARGAR